MRTRCPASPPGARAISTSPSAPTPRTCSNCPSTRRGVIGCLELFPAERLAEGDSLFWEKYANRIGFQMHNRIVQDANRRHLRFIRNLAKDIGHNVIVPNMYFKLFFNRLKRTIDQLGEVPGRHAAPSSESRREILALHQALHDQYDEISRHYEQTSLYLETLLRQSHFEKGRYVLERRPCHVPSQIIAPQLHQFLPRFRERGIAVTPCPERSNDPDLTLPVTWGSSPRSSPTCSPTP